MIENQAKEELIEMKAKPEQRGKTCRKISWGHLGVGNSRLGEPVISMNTPEDSSLVCLGIASLRLGERPPSADEDTCLCLGEAQFA